VLARTGSLSPAGDARPALLESAAYRVSLPRHGLLTFGMGLTYAGSAEPPGWYLLNVRAGGHLLATRRLNPRAVRGWREVSLPLEGLGSRTTLEFDLRLVDREGKDVSLPGDLVLGVAEPVVHDLDEFGRAKGVILISIDTLRRDHVGAYGYTRPTTPHLDAMAREGLVFEDAVSTSSWTLPAHLSLLTSMDPGGHGGTDMKHAFNRRVPTLARLLRDAGFASQAVTSHLYVSSVYGLDAGFDHLDFHQDRKAGDVAERAIDLLDRFGDRPFFLFLHFYDPHWHYDPPETMLRLFETSYSGRLTGLWQDFSKRDRASLSASDLAHLLALYDGEIRYVDEELGRLFDHVSRRGLEKNTLVVVTSDHGEEFLDHGSWEHQKTLYEEVIRVPLVVRGPGVRPRREPAQVSLLDVAPTILEWAGVPPPATLQGRSLLGSVSARPAYGETEHTADGTRKVFLRAGQGSWKTILSLPRQGDSPEREEWYDLAADPKETQNRSPRGDVAGSLRQEALGRFTRSRQHAGEAPAVALSPEQREQLRALGYVGP
jgi:arylsulfatase A-like enzyme